MSGQTDRDIIFSWWKTHIGAREKSQAKALSARLRRGNSVAILCEPEVQDLARKLGLGPTKAENLVRLVTLLAELREHVPIALPKRLGGAEPVLSTLRFQRLMRADPQELTALLRRAIVMADCRCDVAQLAGDLLQWNEATRTRWTFDYFGADAPQSDLKETTP